MTGVNEWTQLLLGSGATGVPILGLVLTGRLIPIWVVNRQVAALEKSSAESIAALKASHAAALVALEASHQRELTSQEQAHANTLAVRDREAERLAQAAEYERGAKDIERNRSDALADRLAGLAGEFGSNHAKLVDAVSEAAGRDR